MAVVGGGRSLDEEEEAGYSKSEGNCSSTLKRSVYEEFELEDREDLPGVSEYLLDMIINVINWFYMLSVDIIDCLFSYILIGQDAILYS